MLSRITPVVIVLGLFACGDDGGVVTNPTTCATFEAKGFACAHGACSDAEGWPGCDCEPGYGGALCAACEAGMQDNDGNGTCLPTCATADAVGLGCGGGECSDSGGAPACACSTPYEGTLCDRCKDESIDMGNGTCLFASATCSEIKLNQPTAVDGTFTLYVGNDKTQPWTAYCRNMTTATPIEFLTLTNTGGSYNFGQYTAGGASPGTNVRTSFTRVRINPTTFAVDISDTTFASSAGALMHSNDNVNTMPLGVAMSCDSSASGAANINLTGTAFRINETYCLGGSGATGTATFTSNNQILNVAGGGFCGWYGPTPDGGGCLFNPYNTAAGFALNLEYIAP